MLQFFRSFFSSRIGIAITLAFVGLMALVFATADVASNGAFGGVAGGDRVATVGKARISTSDLERAAANSVEQLREEDKGLTMKSFIAQGGLDQLLDNLIDLTAVRAFGEKHGVQVGDRLVDSEIAKIPAAQGPSGKFDEGSYRSFLAQRKITDEQLRRQITEAMMARQLLSPAEIGVATPKEALQRYAGIITERRVGAIALIPSSAFAAKTPPSDADISAWYAAHKGDYMLPERRTIRFATYTDAAVKNVPAPTDAEIKARFDTNRDQYAASESRKITQLVLPTEAAAKAILSEVGTGKSLEAVAGAKGLAVGSLGTLTRQGLSSQTSQALADAAFGAVKGAPIGPIKAPLGWTILRVDGVEGKAARTLDQVRGELVQQIAMEKRRAALTDFSARIEDEFSNGAALGDVAKELGLTITETPALLANGAVFAQPGKTVPPQLAKVLSSAFAMEGEKQPQLAEAEPGKVFVIYDVGTLSAAAPAPLAEIKQAVAVDIQLSKGSAAAKAAAQKIEAAARKGGDIAAAVAALGVPLPPVERVDMARQQVQAMGPRTPPPLQMLFSMAKGSVKLLGAPRNRGWYVVQLKDAIPGKIEANDPRLGDFARSIAQLQSTEFADQLRAAMRSEVGAKRNANAIKAVRDRLAGTGTGN